MKLHHVGSNQTVVILTNGNQVFFSYETPVAAYVHGKGYVRTTTNYSRTTSKHITQWLHGVKADSVEQEVIDALTA